MGLYDSEIENMRFDTLPSPKPLALFYGLGARQTARLHAFSLEGAPCPTGIFLDEESKPVV